MIWNCLDTLLGGSERITIPTDVDKDQTLNHIAGLEQAICGIYNSIKYVVRNCVLYSCQEPV